MSDNGNNKVPLRDYVDQAVKSLREYFEHVFRGVRDYSDQADKNLQEEIRKSERFTLTEISKVETRTADKFEVLQTTIKGTGEQLRLSNDKIVSAMEVRLEGMNQFRAQMQEERGNFVSKDTLNLIVDNMRKENASSIDTLRNEVKTGIATLRDDIKPLRDFREQMRGGTTQERTNYQEKTDASTRWIAIAALVAVIIDVLARVAGH